MLILLYHAKIKKILHATYFVNSIVNNINYTNLKIYLIKHFDERNNNMFICFYLTQDLLKNYIWYSQSYTVMNQRWSFSSYRYILYTLHI